MMYAPHQVRAMVFFAVLLFPLMKPMFEDQRRALALLDALREVAAAKPVSVRVNGDCMAPLVRDGAKVELSAPARFYWPGDVVVVWTGARGFALHRIIGSYRRAGQWKFITRGDRTERPDTAVTVSEIVGRIAGGECAERLVNIPLHHRLKACVRFLVYAVKINIKRSLPREFR